MGEGDGIVVDFFDVEGVDCFYKVVDGYLGDFDLVVINVVVFVDVLVDIEENDIVY